MNNQIKDEFCPRNCRCTKCKDSFEERMKKYQEASLEFENRDLPNDDRLMQQYYNVVRKIVNKRNAMKASEAEEKQRAFPK